MQACVCVCVHARAFVAYICIGMGCALHTDQVMALQQSQRVPGLRHQLIILYDMPLQGELAAPELFQEAAILQRLMYKNKQQHREAGHFKHLQEVCYYTFPLRMAAGFV